MSPLSVTLSPAPNSGTFPFTTKCLLLSDEVSILLGSAGQPGAQGEPRRVPQTHNGWFGPLNYNPSPKSLPSDDDVYPLSLSAIHARIWAVYIRDMGAAFKTYVNGSSVSNDMELRSGDILTLGSKIPRNKNTPAHITDDHLNPIIAVVTIS